MPCLSPFKKYIEDLFEAYDASGPLTSLGAFISDNSGAVVEGMAPFGIYPIPEFCCPSCDATDDPCGNIYFFGSVETFLNLAENKRWITSPGSVPCCYNFMGAYDTILRLEGSMCWSSIERCCNEFDTCFKTFITTLEPFIYAQFMDKGIVEYGAINDPDNICFLKNYLENRYEDLEKIQSYLNQILDISILIVCPVGGTDVWVITTETYVKFCESLQ